MILGFADATTHDVYHGIASKAARRIPQRIWRTAFRKLDMLNGAIQIEDMSSPPGNRLERLRGDLKGLYSIRINDQFRIIFGFEGGNATRVQITDYH